MPPEPMRLDKWLWCARWYPTRSRAAAAVRAGKVKVNETRAKPALLVKPGDVLVIRRGARAISLIVNALAPARQSAKLAVSLYAETAASIKNGEMLRAQFLATAAMRPGGHGRPSKQQRRALLKFTGRAR